MNSTDNDVCKLPFYMAEISENGNVYPCCPRFINFLPMATYLKLILKIFGFQKRQISLRQIY